MIAAIISSIVTGGIVLVITLFATSKIITRSNQAKIGNAEEQASKIIDSAKKEAEGIKKDAENLKKEARLSAKEEALKLKNELEEEVKERRNEVAQYEKRIITKEENLDKKMAALEEKDQLLTEKQNDIEVIKNEALELKDEQRKTLEEISGMTGDEAKEYLLNIVREDIKDESARIIKSIEEEAKEEGEKRAKDIIVSAISRCDMDHISEACVSVVELEAEEMKGRIIGREGRNIRTFETLTGVELIVDDTPEAVVLSCFNPIRRQIAKIALERLVADGRIHPARIEDMVEKATKEVNSVMKQKGEEAVMELGLTGIHPEIMKLIGRMHYRTSYGQNVLKHSLEVARLTGMLAAELGEDEKLAKRAGLLHDIGKAVDFEMEGSHVQIGSDICKKYKEHPVVINAVESHHGDKEADNVISVLVQCADTISAARPGARREDIEVYINRLKKLEEISESYEGVEKSFAIQAGREVRIMVVPEKISDSDMVLLARDISKQIENELQYPGQIKVSVIRESRAIEYAK